MQEYVMQGTLFYLLSSFWVGAVHAATPGHGKTITAAYLVGARGKPIDALILGIFVTLSHTSGILLVGILASLGSAWLAAQRIEAYIALVTGLLVIGLALWMLWTQRDIARLALGRPRASGEGEGAASDIARAIVPVAHSDVRHSKRSATPMTWHSHEGAHSHTHGHNRSQSHIHDHSHADAHTHSHDHGQTYHSHDQTYAEVQPVTWHRHGWGSYHAHRLDVLTDNRPKLGALLALSIAGGLLPDPTALAILIGSLSSGKVMLGFATVVAFSLGFASALVVVGVIAAKIGQKILGWLSSIWVVRVQILTTLLILGMGCVLTGQAVIGLLTASGS
jgi:nickel/cobalt transporter (NicO) family protein